MLVRICIAFVVLYISCQISSLKAQENTTKKLKVLTWNIYSLPFFINNTNRVERAKGLVNVLQKSDYDVIVLQETFHKKSSRIIEEGLKKAFPYHIKVNRKGGFLKYHHGVFMLSKLPAIVLGNITFNKCKGSDCLSKKGAILVEVEKEGQKFQILGTHLQSGFKDKFEAIRKTQRQEITLLLNKHKKNNVTQLLCGDFNTNYNNITRRKHLLNDLEIGKAIVADETTWPHKFHKTKKNHTAILDYIFIKPNNFDIDAATTRVHHFSYKKHKAALSDHSAVEMMLSWK